MRMRIIIAAVLVCVLSGCTMAPAETKSENEAQIELSADETEEDITQKEADFSRGDLRTMFEEINNEEIENFLYDDYNKDGLHEAFVLTKTEHNHNLWYFHPKECEIVCEEIEGVEPLETDILTFPTRGYLLLQQIKDGKRNTMVFSIDNNNKVFEAEISQKGYMMKAMNGELWLQTDQGQQINPNQAEVNTYHLYYVFDEGFREYGAIPIGTEQFLEFEGAQDILEEITDEYPDYQIEYSFLYRTNHYINVNITLIKNDSIEYKNLTLNYDDYGVKRISEQLADGKMEIAYILDIATFPTAFKHPKINRNVQENGG